MENIERQLPATSPDQPNADIWKQYFEASLVEDYDTASYLIGTLLALEPDNPVVYMEMGNLALDMEDLPASLELFHNTAATFLAKGQVKAALALYRIILRLDPDDDVAREMVEEIQLGFFEHARSMSQDQQPQAIEEPLAEAAALTEVAELKPPEFFEGLDPQEVAELESGMSFKAYGNGEEVFHEGEEEDTMYIIKGGKALVTIEADGRNLAVACLSEGEYFGEMSLLKKRPRSATVSALGDLVVMEIGRATVKDWTGRHPEILKSLVEIYNYRVRDLQKKLSTS